MNMRDTERQWYEIFLPVIIETSEHSNSTEETDQDVEELLNDALGG